MANEERTKQLGMPYGTAYNKLRKAIMFDLVKKCGLDTCCKCGKKIEKIDELSIEHLTPWMHADNAVELFFDMDNISFSHLKCNVADSRSPLKNESYFRKRIGKAGYYGVYYESNKNYTNKYRATVSGKTLGNFFTAKEAAEEVDKELIRLFGNNAITNKSLGLL